MSTKHQTPVYLVTGATDGIGKATALALAQQEAEVVLHGRNPDKLEATLAELRSLTGNTNLHGVGADFASLADVALLADQVLEKFPGLQVLVNNAGGLTDHRQQSHDGFELTFAVNYLAPFLLTMRLLDRLKENAPGRIVHVSSTALGGGVIDFDNLQLEQGFSGWQAYANSKLANAYFSFSLAQQLEGCALTSNALCPGLIDTNFFHTNTVFGAGAYERMRPGMRSAEEGALVPLFLAAAPEAADISGQFYIREGRDGRRILPLGLDPRIATNLWDHSMTCVQPWLAV
jgi:NAD(P)-dependent dehydrogenase (short-subunit alcohol dehydrogenase family)